MIDDEGPKCSQRMVVLMNFLFNCLNNAFSLVSFKIKILNRSRRFNFTVACLLHSRFAQGNDCTSLDNTEKFGEPRPVGASQPACAWKPYGQKVGYDDPGGCGRV